MKAVSQCLTFAAVPLAWSLAATFCCSDGTKALTPDEFAGIRWSRPARCTPRAGAAARGGLDL